ncbi:DNA repair protein XRCC1 [Lingula anatina]|uniref:DNA repair protein XRCC1 n=1 Tax=Lingula anatina TaxID=7574 RepID=A0A1S3I8I1_LINAN|nr:DNA repair protein XRCC1 [Lingula anatina]|eukprot:XP_013394562.1 DNA repair protein XRCC1 [Lingula anatina]
MPEIKIQHVVSCSSEDKNNPAENLLKPEGKAKWKSAASGEKQVSVVLQFEKSSQVHQIDIGNEGAAFIEVLVGKSTQTSDQDYQVLLVASSFLSPIESRNGTNMNRVRIFTADKLSKAVVEQKWDRVKVVCTQPFNKNIPYGLSFIKFHSPPDKTSQNATNEGGLKLGAFSLKTTDEDQSVSTGSLFASRKQEPEPLTGAAAVRAASKLSSEQLESREKEKNGQTVTPAKRKHEDSHSDKPSVPTKKPVVKKPEAATSRRRNSDSDTPPPPKKKKTQPAAVKKPKPFRELMKGVVFVMSGYQNPQRGELRDKAIEMGAQYRPDWGRGCTHLICAFSNTPKFQQVDGKGCIVSHQWIKDSHRNKKLMNWKDYKVRGSKTPPGLQDAGSSGSEYSPSEEEEEDVEEEDEWEPKKKTKPQPKQVTPKTTQSKKKNDKEEEEDEEEEEEWDPKKRTKAPSKKESPRKPSPVKDSKQNEEEEDEDEEWDPKKRSKPQPKKVEASPKKKIPDPSPVKPTASPKHSNDSGDDTDAYDAATDVGSDSEDTEDEIRRIKEEQLRDKGEGKSSSKDGGSGDLPDLPDFFSGKHFFLYGDFSATERRTIFRYITAFDGELEDYMDDKVTFVITNSDWDDKFDQALSENTNLIFVRPKWIFACHDKNKLLPYQPYIVVPAS